MKLSQEKLIARLAEKLPRNWSEVRGQSGEVLYYRRNASAVPYGEYVVQAAPSVDNPRQHAAYHVPADGDWIPLRASPYATASHAIVACRDHLHSIVSK